MGKHALAFIGLRAFHKQLHGPAKIPLSQPLLTKPICDVRVLIKGVNNLC